MDQANENNVAIWIKDGRLRKGYTQQELSDLTGISIRSVQRIENGEVIPREYTLRLLAEKLDLKDILAMDSARTRYQTMTSVRSQPVADQPLPDDGVNHHVGLPARASVRNQLNKPRKIVLSVGIGLFLIFGALGFISQSPRFPETTFEGFCFWSVIIAVYTAVLFRVWK